MPTPFPFSTGQVLTAAQMNETADVPRAFVYNTTDLVMAAAAYTRFLYNSEDFDTHSMHSTTSNTGRLTVQTGWAGYYYFFANAVLSAASSLVFYKNGTLYTYGDAGTQASVSAILNLAVGDYIEVFGYPAGGATAYGTGSVGGRGHCFGCIWVAPS